MTFSLQLLPYLDLPHASVFCLCPLLFILNSAGIPTLSQSTQPLCILLPMMSRPMSMVLLLNSSPFLRPLRSPHCHDIFSSICIDWSCSSEPPPCSSLLHYSLCSSFLVSLVSTFTFFLYLNSLITLL